MSVSLVEKGRVRVGPSCPTVTEGVGSYPWSRVEVGRVGPGPRSGFEGRPLGIVLPSRSPSDVVPYVHRTSL